jgi:FHA domain-containing protein
MSTAMIEVEVVEANGTPQAQGLGARFDGAGGTIGRAPTNTLALPDPERRVSRVHAQIVPRPTGMAVISRSPNGMYVNGTFVAFGDEIALNEGTTLAIGGYTLRARLSKPGPTAGADDTTVRMPR